MTIRCRPLISVALAVAFASPAWPQRSVAQQSFKVSTNLDFKRVVQAYLLAILAGSSQKMRLLVNADGSVDLYFGPKAPPGKENNWMQTVPGKGWNTILRLYGPLESWFDKSWRPGEIERQS